ncbi:MAG: hypothetical protein K0R57_6235 [Paenibacillaceae bacterium]|jgi:hypothetical protein|nr:hypothetical protein [Paenibacillaceae bacterium]
MGMSDIRLTASEVGYLWSGYMVDHMSVCMMTYLHEKSSDQQVKQLIRTALDLGYAQLDKRKQLLGGEGVPIPRGFSMEEDVHLDAPALFSDKFCLNYLLNATRLGLEFFSNFLGLAVREDIRALAQENLQTTGRLYDSAMTLLLERGEYLRPPVLTPPGQPEFIQKTSFLNGIFGDKRPLMSMEISGLYSNIEMVHLLEAVSTAFAQTGVDPKVKALLVRTKEMAAEHGAAMKTMLEEDELHAPARYLSEISNSQRPPFSDRLMLCHAAGLKGALIQAYGYATGHSMRNDLAALYLSQMGQAGILTEAITKTLIEYEWLEKTPGAPGRRVLS